MQEQDEMLRRYFKDINQYPLITPEREKELSNIIHGEHSTDKEKNDAKQELILGNLKLVLKIAINVRNSTYGMDDMNVSLMDMVQAGNVGLMRACDLFLTKRNCKFVTYAYIIIQRYIMRVVKESRFVRLPLPFFKWMHEMDNITEKNKNMNNKDLAKKMHIMKETVEVLKRNRFNRVDIEDFVADDMINKFDSGEPLLTDAISHNQLRGYIYNKIKELKPRYREVLGYRFFSNNAMTLTQVGKKMGMTREGIRQIERHALRKLRAKIDEETTMGKYKKGEKHENKRN